jgi:hypothetical protein
MVGPSDLAAAMSAAAPFALLEPEAVDLVPRQGNAGGQAACARFAPGGSNHATACACCAGRTPVAVALDGLFQARIRGGCDWFDRVLALVPDEAARQEVAAALRDDPLTVARFRLC